MNELVMWGGFILASYAVVGNDSIQTLGTFLTSNEKRPWYQLWLFAGSILTFTLIYGWINYNGDVSYARLSKYPLPVPMDWYYILPPLVLMSITRLGIPVSTSFMVLTFFNEKNLANMAIKSISGYLLAFFLAALIYYLITKKVESKFGTTPMTDSQRKFWVPLQWLSTGFLWSMWLIQDFANIYVYLPRQLDSIELIASLIIILSLLGYIFYTKGGKIQNIVRVKTNTMDVRSATIIDALYGVILFFFKELNNIPMSTTWVFIGLLAGRELSIRYQLNTLTPSAIKDVLTDLFKVFLGLVISVLLVYIIKAVRT